MGVTKFDNLSAIGCSAKMVTSFPSLPGDYFGAPSNDVDSVEWRGGEIIYHSSYNCIFIQMNESGTTPSWRKLTEMFSTSTTTTSTSTTTTTSTSSTTTTTTSTSSTTTTTSSTTSTSSTTTTTTSTSSSTSTTTSTSTSTSSTTTS